MLSKAVIVDVAVEVQTISSVTGCERFPRHRAEGASYPVVEDVLTFISTESSNGGRYETEISRTDCYCNDLGLRELVRKRFHA